MIRRFFRHNWFLKLFSVVLASLLWLTIASESNSVIDRTIPLDIRGFSTNMETTGETATEVVLRLRGSRTLLNNLSPADVTAVISLPGQTPGQKNIVLTEDNFQTSGGVTVIRWNPQIVQFNLERTLTRTVPVSATIEGMQAEGFIQGDTTVNPPTVQVSGPESAVSALESLPTEGVTIEGAQADVYQSVAVDLAEVDALVRVESFSQHEVTIEIHEVTSDKTFLIGSDPQLEATEWVVDPAEITVQISGPNSLMNSFDPEGISFTINVSALEPGTYTLQPEVLGLGDAFMVTSIEPSQVEVQSAEQ